MLTSQKSARTCGRSRGPHARSKHLNPSTSSCARHPSDTAPKPPPHAPSNALHPYTCAFGRVRRGEKLLAESPDQDLPKRTNMPSRLLIMSTALIWPATCWAVFDKKDEIMKFEGCFWSFRTASLLSFSIQLSIFFHSRNDPLRKDQLPFLAFGF